MLLDITKSITTAVLSVLTLSTLVSAAPIESDNHGLERRAMSGKACGSFYGYNTDALWGGACGIQQLNKLDTSASPYPPVAIPAPLFKSVGYGGDSNSSPLCGSIVIITAADGTSAKAVLADSERH